MSANAVHHLDFDPNNYSHVADHPEARDSERLFGDATDAQIGSPNGKVYVSNNTQPAASSARNIQDTVTNGPVAQSVKNQAQMTTREFQDLASAKNSTPGRAATGQHLSHYHTLFYRLLSWKDPRATAISYVTIVLAIFSARYLDALSFILKALFFTLGSVAIMELGGQMSFGNGLISQIRPKKYYVVPRETIELILDDVEQLINFFVIEFQRIIFAENVYATMTAFLATFLSYWLIKWLPLWGLALIGTSTLYFGPLIYLQNKSFIDSNLRDAGKTINKQAIQVRELATRSAGQASETIKHKAGDYSHKAQEMLDSAKSTIVSKTSKTRAAAVNTASNSIKSTKGSTGRQSSGVHTVTDLPSAPKVEPALRELDEANFAKARLEETQRIPVLSDYAQPTVIIN